MEIILFVSSFLALIYLSYHFSKKLKANKEFKHLSTSMKYLIYLAWAIVPFCSMLSYVRFIFFDSVQFKKDINLSIVVTIIAGLFISQRPSYRFFFYNNLLSPSFSYVLESAYSAKMAMDLKDEVSIKLENCNDVIECLDQSYREAVLKRRIYRNMYSLLFAVNVQEAHKNSSIDKSAKPTALIETNFKLIELYKESTPFHSLDFSASIFSPIAGLEAILIAAIDTTIDTKALLNFLDAQDNLIEKVNDEVNDINLNKNIYSN